MTEIYPVDADLNALSGTSDPEQGVPYIPIGESPYYTSFYRMLYGLLNVARRSGDLRVYKDGDLTFGVRAGNFFRGDQIVSFHGAVNQSLANNMTTYIYLTPTGTLTTNTTGFPAPSNTPHIPLATITTAAGTYATSDIIDHRGRVLFRPADRSLSFFSDSDITAGEAETLTNGSYADSLHTHAFTLPDSSITDAKLASKICKRVAAKAANAVYFTNRPGDDQLLIINGRRYETDNDGDFPQSGGHVAVNLSGNATLADDLNDLASAINNDSAAEVTAVADTACNMLWLVAKTAGVAGNALTLASTLSHSTVSAANFTGGAEAQTAVLFTRRHTITAAEASAGVLRIDTGLSGIHSAQVQFEDLSDGQTISLIKISINQGIVKLLEGAQAWEAGDVLDLLIVGTH